jgi:hypothetical protein
VKGGVTLVALVIAVGCSSTRSTIGILGSNPDLVGTKLLIPGAYASSCRSSVLGIATGPGDPSATEALGALLARDAEANVVVNAEVTARTVLTGVWNRRCIEVRGDVARMVSTVTLPMPASHGEHRHH